MKKEITQMAMVIILGFPSDPESLIETKLQMMVMLLD